MEELQQQINTLKDRLDALNSSTTIPFEVAVAIKARLEQDFTQGDSSATTAGSQTQAVNEGGIATYNVAKPMTGFIEVIFRGITYNVPYY